jgi:hypothetical protein
MKNKTKGVLLLVGPIVLLVLTLSLWAISKFVIANLQTSQNQNEITIQTETNGTMFEGENQVGVLQEKDLRTTVSSLISVILSLIGLIAVIGILIGAPLGIYYLSKSEDEKNYPVQTPQTQEKYRDLTPEQIAYINKWSWGAFFAFPIWVLGNGLYMWVFATFIPFFNIYAVFKLAMHGRKMAWEEETWKNFDEFKQRQKIMAWIIFVIIILATVGEFV